MTIPVFLLTGFLGAGKTTLLRTLLRTPEFARTAVLVNEVGEVGIDQHLVGSEVMPAILMDGGCVCCSVQGDLGLALRNLALLRERGDIPEFDRVVIETSGIACPGPVLHKLASDDWIRAQFAVHSVITVVDCQFGPEAVLGSAEAREQVSLADRFVVTKSDVVPVTDLTAATTLLRQCNGLATITLAINGECDPADLLSRPDYPGSSHDAHACSPHAEGLSVSTAVAELDRALPWPALARALDSAAREFYDVLLRTKGLCHVAESSRPVLVQGVRHFFFPPELLAAWPRGEAQTALTFIAKDQNAARVRDRFKALLEEAAAPISG